MMIILLWIKWTAKYIWYIKTEVNVADNKDQQGFPVKSNLDNTTTSQYGKLVVGIFSKCYQIWRHVWGGSGWAGKVNSAGLGPDQPSHFLQDEVRESRGSCRYHPFLPLKKWTWVISSSSSIKHDCPSDIISWYWVVIFISQSHIS